MIYCYSATQKSKAYAQLLGEIINCPVYMLDCALDPTNKISFFFSAAFRKSLSVVENMPVSIDSNEIYLVGPIWAGEVARPIKYFLENAPLSGKRVNMLLTAAICHEKYISEAERLLAKLDCIPGEVQVFATPKEGIDKEMSEAHIRELFNV